MNKHTLSPERITLTGAFLGAFVVAMQSDIPASIEAFSQLGGKVIVGAAIGAYVTKLVTARLSVFNAQATHSPPRPKV